MGTSLSSLLSLLPVGSAVLFAVLCAYLVARAENRADDRRAR
ncbi:MAG TPA: hypothetical protein VMU66_03530 [Gaiellales bacterium]|nr:hypothetical protein [Gaiellales bacterium]